MKLLNQFYLLIKPGWIVLDLGAGEGRQVSRMLEVGAKIIAVDRKEPKEKDPAVSWHVAPIEEWMAKLSDDDMFDAILARNSLQFFDKDFVRNELLPILSKHLKSGGLFEIETFYEEPLPPFNNPFRSLWIVDELKEIFPEWEIVASEMEKENTTDLSGQLRDFYKTGLLVKKP